jgi:hypothetical protein
MVGANLGGNDFMRFPSPLGAAMLLLPALPMFFASCRQPSHSATEAGDPPWFMDVTERVGLNFVHDAGALGRYFMPQIMGSGAALFDFDNDGRLDIYLVQNGGPGSASTNRLFRQGPDGKFTDVSKGSGLDVSGYGMGVAIGDVNNDGWQDVLVTEYGGIRLFLNNGNGTFSDITKEAGLDNPLWGTSASFVDYDRDGWLDLVVVNYVDYDPTKPCTEPSGKPDYCGPSSFPGTVPKLYRNRGRLPGSVSHAVRFDDVSLSSGIGRIPGPGLGVVCADFNGDRWPDIFIANDGEPNRLWINQHDGTFKEEAVVRGVAYNGLGRAEANMGIALGDLKGDGDFAVFVTHLTEQTNTLWAQGPRGMFQDRTAGAGLASPGWRATGFGTVLADFDHDGGLDLAIVNGRVRRTRTARVEDGDGRTLGPYWSAYAERNQLFANDGTGFFRDVSRTNPVFCAPPGVARGLACGDVDGDGALDVLVTTVAGPARLYRNIAPRRHWLLVRVVDPRLKRDAYGAVVILFAGGERQRRWINPAYSYLCSNDPRAHFGLGHMQRVEAIDVVWPDGSEETFPSCAADQVVTLRKGEGKELKSRN